MNDFLHLVAFDNPYPPYYGGAIDIYYKIISLKEKNIKVILHIIGDFNEEINRHLEDYCEEIYYYSKGNKLTSLFSLIPYRVKIRANLKLLINLQRDNYPILFEGLHTCYYVKDLKERPLFVRAHNVEHDYHYLLAKSESNILKKIFLFIEAYKFNRFENILHKVTGVFSISPFEQAYFNTIYNNKSVYIPAFHAVDTFAITKDKEKFVLYHGNLNVSENLAAVLKLISVYKDSAYNFIIASTFKERFINRQIKNFKNIKFVKIVTEGDLNELLQNAHINILITAQKTGIKLKLLNALYKGKFVIANNEMIDDTGLESLCVKANTKQEILIKTKKIMQKDYTLDDKNKRLKVLKSIHPRTSVKKMLTVIFN